MPTVERIGTWAEIEAEFIARAHAMVWCNVATVDAQGRPRSRLMHPIWECSTGWIGTRRGSLKGRDLARSPYVSLAYVSDVAKPAYADCLAEWADDAESRHRVWNLFLDAAPPLGYDPGPIFGAADDPGFGVLKLTPWRVTLRDMMSISSRIWKSDPMPARASET